MGLQTTVPVNRDILIEENKSFIFKTTCRICKRKLNWENDDELSVALVAFNKACDSYKEDKGSFNSYAGVLIKNALIDFFRKEKNSPYLIFDDENENDDYEYIDYKNSMNEYQKQKENNVRADEIKLLSTELLKYNLSFSDMVEASPSHRDTRNTLLNIALKCLKEKIIIDSIKQKKQLPIKQIILLTQCSRKIIEKWRKYIILLIIVLSSNEYPYIRSYLNIKAGEKIEEKA